MFEDKTYPTDTSNQERIRENDEICEKCKKFGFHTEDECERKQIEIVKEYRKSTTPFEEYLKNIHAENYMGTDDDMPDSFEDFISNLDGDVLVKYGNKFAKKLLALIKEQS